MTPDKSASSILVVDDHEDAATSLADLLRAEGHCVLVAYDAESALDLDAQTVLECVLIDIRMPNVDGAELARLLRDRHGPGMVLVGITGDASVDAVRDPRLSCLDHCFRKPIGRDQLARIL